MNVAPPTCGFALYRILGNSLPPRHAAGNTVKNLQFILKNEDAFADTKKIWILNTFIDAAEAADIRNIITAAGQDYIEIPFSAAAHYDAFLDVSGLPKPFEEDYVKSQTPPLSNLRFEWMIRHKSLQIANINHARNVALRQGRKIARWTLPLDGGVFVNSAGWTSFVDRVTADQTSKFMLIPMARVTSIENVNDVKMGTHADEEPQIAIRWDAEDEFDERLRYGNANKTELFKRIGFPGIWDRGMKAPWDKHPTEKSKNAGFYGVGGLVVRLPTGAIGNTEKNSQTRWASRFDGIETLSASLDLAEASQRFDKSRLLHGYGRLKPRFAAQLEALCEDCMNDDVLSILDQKSIAPSGDPKDFICSPRYSKLPGATDDIQSLAKASYTQDVAGLDRFLRHSSILAYGGHALGQARFSHRAVEFLKVWMVNDKTRMNPHLKYAQYSGKDDGPEPPGIVVARDLWLLPQTIDLLRASGVLEAADDVKVQWWCKQMVRGLSKSEQFQSALSYRNNISTWAAAIVASLSLHTGELASSMILFRRAMVKFAEQVGHLNVQYFEMGRARPLHYCLFNLAGWCVLASIFKRVGIDILKYQGRDGENLQGAIRLLSQTRELFVDYHSNAAEFDVRIDVTLSLLGVSTTAEVPSSFMFNRDWGFAPLWPVCAPNGL